MSDTFDIQYEWVLWGEEEETSQKFISSDAPAINKIICFQLHKNPKQSLWSSFLWIFFAKLFKFNY